MTTERQQPSQQELAPEGGDGLDFQIVDETPPEQLEVEAELDAEAGQVAEVDAPEPSTEGEETPASTESQIPQAPQQTSPEPENPSEQPAPRTYTQEEVSKIQSHYMRQAQEAQRKAQEAQAKIDGFSLETEVEATLRAQERQLEAQYGVEEARRLVRTPENQAQVREGHQTRQENARLKAERDAQGQQAELQAKSIIAQQLISQNSLNADDYEVLMESATPSGMQRMAQRLASQSQQRTMQQQQLRNRVPPETAATRLETGRSTAAPVETPERKLERIRQKASWEWSDEETRFMRDGR